MLIFTEGSGGSGSGCGSGGLTVLDAGVDVISVEASALFAANVFEAVFAEIVGEAETVATATGVITVPVSLNVVNWPPSTN